MTKSEQLAESIQKHLDRGGLVKCWNLMLDSRHVDCVRGSNRDHANGVFVKNRRSEVFVFAHQVQFSSVSGVA